MSWSYYGAGIASNVKKQAAEQLARTAKITGCIPSEQAAVKAFAAVIDAACDEAEGQAVKVNGNGSAWLENGKLRSFSFEAKIEVIDLQDRS